MWMLDHDLDVVSTNGRCLFMEIILCDLYVFIIIKI